MRIKQVDIIGFKSFVDKVSLPFQEGINVVVGPNGCGKSNILDAIRWAMGEQSAKNLRGSSMEDVIFKGSAARKGLGMAEVSLILSAEDGIAPEPYQDCSEIMVTRRLFRDGESEYYINKSRCRRLDIQELFLDTGVGAKSYAIIEQGNIETILRDRPEERRSLIEDAAGVMKFKVRKKAALRKIEAARLNLSRLEDVIAEVRRQASILKRQAQKAERFRECRRELKAIDIGFAQRRYRLLKGQEDELAVAEGQHREAVEELEGQIAGGEEGLVALKTVQAAREKEIERTRGALLRLAGDIDRGSQRLDFNRREAERLGLDRERFDQERKELERRREELHREREALTADLATLDAEIIGAEGELQAGAEKLVYLQEAEERQSRSVTALREKLFSCLSEISRFANRREDAERRLDNLEGRLRRSREDAVLERKKGADLEGERAAAEASLAAAQSRREGLAKQESAIHERRKELDALISTNREALAALREEYAAGRSRLEALAEIDATAGFGNGGSENPPDGAARRVVDCLTVDRDEEQLFETFLGERLQARVVEKETAPELILAWLRKQNVRNRFCFFFDVPRRSPFWEGGVPLAELLTAADQDRPLLKNLVAGAYRVESLEPFLNGRIPEGVTLVNRRGEMLSWRGELVVGAGARGNGVLTRKRMRRELEALLRECELKRTRLEHQRQVVNEEAGALEKSSRDVAAALRSETESGTRAERLLADLDNAGKRVRDRLEVLALEHQQLEEECLRLREESLHSLQESTVREGEKDRLQKELQAAQEDFDDFRREVARLREAETGNKVRQAGRVERRRSLGKRLETCRETADDLGGRLERLGERVAENERERKRLAEERQVLEDRDREMLPLREKEKAKLAALEAAAMDGKRSLGVTEEQLRSLAVRVAGEREVINGLRLERQEKSLEKGHLRQAILDRFRCDLEQQQQGEGDWDDQRQELRRVELQRQLDSIGEVNLTALEEFQVLEERLTFLVAQQNDLIASVADLETTIQRINSTTCRRFRDAFEQINGRFQQVFPRLFAGGRAELHLTDEGNLLETGVEIIAQPPGKRLQELGLLSGGEKALTAIALVFATFMVRPSPFCLLDEVDAPLDDANTDRYNDLIQELAKKSQFIIITHNKRTMGTGDALYGITMEEQGVSKVVSVRINDFR